MDNVVKELLDEIIQQIARIRFSVASFEKMSQKEYSIQELDDLLNEVYRSLQCIGGISDYIEFPGIKKICDSISITKMGVYIGRLESKKEINQNFVNYGFIPKNQIQKIIFFDKNGNSKFIDFKKQNKGGKK